MIDADALIAKQASIAKTFARSDAQKSLIGRVMYNTEKSPTIDAIPVEWMENKLNTLCFEAMGAGALYGDRIGELAKSINEVMKLWQNEQDER